MSRRLGRSFRALPLLLLAAHTAFPAGPREELRRLFDYDSRQPLDVKLTPVYERSGVRTFDLVYASPKGGMVTGYLVAPSGTGPSAGIVFGHWGPGDRTEFLPEAALYAQAGAVSVTIDYPWVRPAPWRKPQGQGLGKPEKDRDSWINAVVDLRRAIDLLAARPEVDARRIGYVGHSCGAQWGAMSWYDTGHDLNDPKALADRVAWLAPKLDLAPMGAILEKRILDEIGRRLIPDIHDRIVTKFHYAPTDFAHDLNAHLGSAFSLEPVLTQSAYFRGHNRDDVLHNFYLVGAGTHPGAGIPGVVASAKATAGLMLEDLAR